MSDVERIAAGLIAKERKIYKGVSANVDFYSGFCIQYAGTSGNFYTDICSGKNFRMECAQN